MRDLGNTLLRAATHFPAPSQTTAAAPPEARGLARDEVRMLVARPSGLTHATFRDLADHLTSGDLVVFNDSATIKAQADGVLTGQGAVVVHVAGALDTGERIIELRTAPDARDPVLNARPGDVVTLGQVALQLLAPYPYENSSPTGRGNRLWRTEVSGSLDQRLRKHGRPIAYGYLDRRYPLSTYQTVFAARPGSAEMPSAGRPFTRDLVTRLVTGGIRMAPVTLHTGVSSQEAGEGPQPERFEVSPAAAAILNATRVAGGRIVAVGTTATRAVESAVHNGIAVPASGWTERVITPDDPPQLIGGLITGWHDPEASHLLLVEAVAGPDLTQRAYDAAVREHYQWHEFGDSALLLP